jgi:uncharacterized membrane protein YdjX (TVP38/TMEM64 family)
MAPLLLAIFTFICLATAAAFVFGTPLLGVPLLVIALIVGAFGMFARRARESGDIHRSREEAKAQKTQFTARDRQTQV